jgi:hypothetical protein
MEETLRNRLWLTALLVVLSAMGALAQRGGDGKTTGEEYVGVWSGTWEAAGGTGGGFELTLEKVKDAAVTGKVSVTGEPTYKADFKSLTLDGKTLNAKYDFPPVTQAEVGLAASFEGHTAKGTWSLRAKANDAEVAAGTWTVTRK